MARLEALLATAPTRVYTMSLRRLRNVHTLYFSEDARAEEAEWRRHQQGVKAFQPAQRFYGTLTIQHLLDLDEAAVRAHFGFSEAELFLPWRAAAAPTATQNLGAAINRQHRIAAIRFLSDACRESGETGYNVAIFKNAVRSPDSFVVHGASGAESQRWPAST